MGHPSDVDPARAVAQPVTRALDVLILGAAASFALSVVAVLMAVLVPEGPIHAVGNVALFGVMGLAVAGRTVHIVRRRAGPNAEAWTHAGRLHGWDAQLARGLTLSVPLAWLVGAVTILVHHETMLLPAVPFMAALLPVVAALWILASFAWHDFCRDRIAVALDESDRRYRAYWKGIGQAR